MSFKSWLRAWRIRFGMERGRRTPARYRKPTVKLHLEELEERVTPSAGALDLTFDSDGFTTTAIGTSTDQAQSVAIDGDGKIVVAGTSTIGATDDFTLARYNADGSCPRTEL